MLSQRLVGSVTLVPVPEDRRFDIALFGATGFVGQLTAEYLAAHAPPGLRVALAGRSHKKLERLRGRLGGVAADWGLLVADSTDIRSLAALAGATRIVATTAGPYRPHGIDLVEVCTTAGTDYADLAGEVLFMRESIERCHDNAVSSGLRIVHACGFDSIPSDLGVLLLHQAAQADAAGELTETRLVVTALKGGPSGGTLASMKGLVDELKSNPSLRRIVGDAYALSPDRRREPRLGNEGDQQGIAFDRELGIWTAPFVMAPVNTRVVRRSNALQDWAYGRRFRYREVSGLGGGMLAPIRAGAVSAGLWGLATGLSLSATRSLLDRLLPAAGEGPNPEARRLGRFQMRIHAVTTSGARYTATLAARGDPGYAATSVMLGESVLCLALDRDCLPRRFGVLTPATAMGPALVDRLRGAGQTLQVERAAEVATS